jgi:hypothetical protein
MCIVHSTLRNAMTPYTKHETLISPAANSANLSLPPALSISLAIKLI